MHGTTDITGVERCATLASDKANACVNLAEELQGSMVGHEYLLGVWLRIVDDEDGGTFQPVRHVFWAEPVQVAVAVVQPDGGDGSGGRL